jgi:hypothetical protein
MGKPKVEPLLKQKNRFAVLADTDSDEDLPDYAPLSPNFGSQAPFAFEPLSLPDSTAAETTEFRVWKNDVTRFSSDTNIFSSPFSRKRISKKEDGWTSIESGPIVPVAATAESQEFPSMLGRGDVADALAWAEKVKTSLEKARHRKLSFFRRTVVLDEKF